jgi:hypothetical protein
MNIDLSNVIVEPLDDGGGDFHQSLSAILERVAPLAATATGLAPEDRIRRLGQAVNVVLDALDDLTGIGDPTRLPYLIEHVSELAVTGDNVEVQIGVAGDLRVDQRHRLVVDEVLYSFQRVPPTLRQAAYREGITTLQRLLALLLLHGWTDSMTDSPEARQAARLAIVDTVQGRLSPGQSAL